MWFTCEHANEHIHKYKYTEILEDYEGLDVCTRKIQRALDDLKIRAGTIQPLATCQSCLGDPSEGHFPAVSSPCSSARLQALMLSNFFPSGGWPSFQMLHCLI